MVGRGPNSTVWKPDQWVDRVKKGLKLLEIREEEQQLANDREG
jgi:ribosomal protein L16/L10AE